MGSSYQPFSTEHERETALFPTSREVPLPSPAAEAKVARRADRALAAAEQLLDACAADDLRPWREAEHARVSVIIPVYNEEQTIADIVHRVLALPLPVEVIVVDDHSTDGTPARLVALAAQAPVKVIRHARNQGKGAALRTGLEAARGEVVVIQDADLEYDPAAIPRLVEPILCGAADVVYGSRYLSRDGQDTSRLHRWGNKALTWMSNLFTGQGLTDMETCQKAFRRRIFETLEISQNRFGVEPELTAKIARRMIPIFEVPVTYRGRGYAEGKKIGLADAFRAVYCIVRYGIAD